MTSLPQTSVLTPLQIARQLALRFATDAAECDILGGTPKQERDVLRARGLLALIIP